MIFKRNIMKRRTITLLLTACIKPNTDDLLKVTDVEVRRKQYQDAITWYLQNTDYLICIGENSGTDVLTDEMKSKYAERIECIIYKSEPILPDRGKGYKEMEIIETCLRESKFIAESDLIVKCTGRLILSNINLIMKLLQKGKSVYGWMNLKYKICDSRFFICTPSFMQHFVTHYKEKVNKEVLFEENLAFCIKESSFPYGYPLFPARVEGIAGGFGWSYHMSDKKYVLCTLKAWVGFILFSLGYWPKKNFGK
jgi:hypothetical protein